MATATGPAAAPAYTMPTAKPTVSLAPYVGPKIDQLVMWRDPKQSGAVFGGATALYVALVLAGSPVLLSLYAVAAASAATVAWQIAAGLFGRPGPPAAPSCMSGAMTDEQLSQWIVKYKVPLNHVLGTLGTLATGKNPVLSAKVAAAALGIAWLIKTISVPATAFLLLIIAFTVPKVYELKKTEIDKALAPVKSKANELYAKVDELVLKKIPKPAKKVE